MNIKPQNGRLKIYGVNYLLREQFIQALSTRFSELYDTLGENGLYDMSLFSKVALIAYNSYYDVHGFHPSVGDSINGLVETFGEPIIKHSNNKRQIWFYSGRVVHILNGVIEKVDIDYGLGINLN